MADREKILALIYDAIDEVNDLLPDEQKVEKTPDAALLGQEGGLDSFGLVNLIVAVEQRVDEEFSATLTLADERAMSQTRSPFRNPATLCDHVSALLDEHHGESNG